MKRLQFLIALFVGKMILFISKVIPRVSGTTWPGGIANIIKKNFAENFQFNDNTRIVMITGTGGKTTTTGMVSQLIESEGKTICTNAVGANMDRGISTTLIKQSSMSGKIDVDYVVLEVDERYLAMMCKQINPDVIIVTNILKDQSQRNGEPGVIMEKIKNAIEGRDKTTLILNGNEPNCASFGVHRDNVCYYGVEGKSTGEEDGFFDVATPCPVCDGVVDFQYENILNIGRFACSKCDFQTPQDTNLVSMKNDKLLFDGAEYDVKYVSKDFMYCYASVLTFAKNEGFSKTGIQKSFNEFKIQSGRVEKMKVGTKTINYLRIKQETPVTLQSAINVATADEGEKIVVLDLSEIADFMPHYTGMYYAYDCDFGKFKNSNVVKYICMSKVVCYDTATRLILEGVNKDDITVLPTNNYDELLKELEKYDCDNVYLLTWMHSYYDCLNSVEKYNKAL